MKKKAAIAVVIISIPIAFIFLTVNVDTDDIGGITGTLVVKPDTPQENIDQIRNALKIAGIGWICVGVVSFVVFRRSSRG